MTYLQNINSSFDSLFIIFINIPLHTKFLTPTTLHFHHPNFHGYLQLTYILHVIPFLPHLTPRNPRFISSPSDLTPLLFSLHQPLPPSGPMGASTTPPAVWQRPHLPMAPPVLPLAVVGGAHKPDQAHHVQVNPGPSSILGGKWWWHCATGGSRQARWQRRYKKPILVADGSAQNQFYNHPCAAPLHHTS